MLTSEDVDANPLHRHERVLGVDAVRVEHVRVAAHLFRVLRPDKFIVCSLMITSEDAVDATLHRHERVLGVDAVRVEHVRVAAHRREEHVLQDGRRQ